VIGNCSKMASDGFPKSKKAITEVKTVDFQ